MNNGVKLELQTKVGHDDLMQVEVVLGWLGQLAAEGGRLEDLMYEVAHIGTGGRHGGPAADCPMQVWYGDEHLYLCTDDPSIVILNGAIFRDQFA